jgi:hypothetical protein
VVHSVVSDVEINKNVRPPAEAHVVADLSAAELLKLARWLEGVRLFRAL